MSKRLGRGVSALFPQSADEVESAGSGGLQKAPLSSITPNPLQPRGAMDEAALEELAASIKEHGLIQPIIVNDEGDGSYTLIAGERRWRAAQRAGLEEVPVIIRDATPQAMLEIALIENIQRADLNALEEAMAYKQLIDEFGLTQEEVADRVGKARPTVANVVRLLDLPEKVQQAVVDGDITSGHARALLGLPTPEAQLAVMRDIVRQGLNVRQTEERVRRLKQPSRPTPAPRKQLPAQLRHLETQFRQRLGTRVNIQQQGKGGRVVIYEAIVED